MNNLSGPLLVALGGVVISFSPVLVRVAAVGPTMAGFYRTLFGAVLLIALALVKGESLWRGKTSLILAGLSALFFGLGLTFWHRGIHSLGPGLSTILANFQVFFLAALAMVFLKERPGPRLFVAMFMAMAGISLLVGLDRFQSDLDYRSGIIFGLSAALAYALYVLVLRKLQGNEDSGGRLANFAMVSLLCAAFMGVEAYLQGESFIIPDIQTWLALLAYGILCQTLGWLMISAGLPRIPASQAGLLLLMQPTGAFIWDVLLFARPTTSLDYLGAALALGAIYLGGAQKAPKPEKAPEAEDDYAMAPGRGRVSGREFGMIYNNGSLPKWKK